MALATGAGALVNGFANMFSSSSANDANLQATRETNDMNARLYQQGLDFNRQERLETQAWNRQQWFDQQQYNSPVNQAQRLRQAGLNPSAIMNGDAAGTVGEIASSSPASAPGTPTMQTPRFNPVYDPSAVSGTISAISDAYLKHQEAQSVSINNESLRDRNIADLENRIADTQRKLSDKDLDPWRKKMLKASLRSAEVAYQMMVHDRDRQNVADEQSDALFNSQMRAFDDQHRMSLQNERAMELANEIQEIFGKRMSAAQLQHIYAQTKQAMASISLMSAQEHFTDAQALHEIEKKAETIARTAGINKQNDHYEEVLDLTKEKMREEIFNLRDRTEYQSYGMLSPFLRFFEDVQSGKRSMTSPRPLQRPNIPRGHYGNSSSW